MFEFDNALCVQGSSFCRAAVLGRDDRSRGGLQKSQVTQTALTLQRRLRPSQCSEACEPPREFRRLFNASGVSLFGAFFGFSRGLWVSTSFHETRKVTIASWNTAYIVYLRSAVTAKLRAWGVSTIHLVLSLPSVANRRHIATHRPLQSNRPGSMKGITSWSETHTRLQEAYYSGR